MMRQILKFMLYEFASLIVSTVNFFRRPKIRHGTVLFIRIDNTGDYVLCRNFIELLKKHEKYRDYRISLLGNAAWRDLAEGLDGNFIEGYIWLKREKFKKDLIYRYRKLLEITSTGYEIALSPIYSREFEFDEWVIKSIYALEKIGSTGNLSNIKLWQKRITDHWYTRLLPADGSTMFEFYRNKEFFENFLGAKLSISRPSIVIESRQPCMELPEKYAVMFIGSYYSFKKWRIDGYAEVARLIKDRYGLDIVLCGGRSDMQDARKFAEYFHGSFVDLVGKKSLMELLYVISRCRILISNETVAPHMAVALGTADILVIYNGTHYGRFAPYPPAISNKYHIVLHPEIEKDPENYRNESNAYGYKRDLDMNDISVDAVIRKADDILSKNIQ